MQYTSDMFTLIMLSMGLCSIFGIAVLAENIYYHYADKKRPQAVRIK
tara:strand:- start:63518 stop:63658 length:141 start_codon:yes stop_codon:yes gene_type:complete